MADTFHVFTDAETGHNFSVVALPDTEFFQYEFVCDVGADIERLFLQKTGRWVYGISHLIEHLSFKTPKDYSTERLMHELKSNGSYNAYTDHHEIVYHYSTRHEKFADAIKMTLNVALNDLGNVGNDEFVSEKNVVFNEIKRYHDDPQTMFKFKIGTSMFQLNEHDDILGDETKLINFTLADCIAIKGIFLSICKPTHRISYDPTVMNLDEIVAKIKSEFKRISVDSLVSSVFIPRKEYDQSRKLTHILDTGCVQTSIENESEQLMINITIPFVKRQMSMVTQQVAFYLSQMARGTSLNDVIREQHGLTYGISFYPIKMYEQDMMYFCVDVPHDKLDKTLELFKHSLKESIMRFDEAAFVAMQEKYKIMSLDANMNRRSALRYHTLPEDSPAWEQYAVYYRDSTKEARKRVVNDWFTFDHFKNLLDEIGEHINNEKFLVIHSTRI